MAAFYYILTHNPFVDSETGQVFPFDAEGEFILSHSTNPGDTFQVQARFEHLDGSASTSQITGIAATVGGDRVTLQSGRADVIWIDGAPATINPATGIVLGGGTVTQPGPSTILITWNTGETLTVVQTGDSFAVRIGLPTTFEAGTVVGLTGPNGESQADTFTLPDGTVLQQPLSTSDLYTTFANAWRVTDTTSLFDYGTGQSTATFTNTNFPIDAISLADLPASIVALAAQAVAAAGITDPRLFNALSPPSLSPICNRRGGK